MAADALDTEYENGVADVLAYLAGDAAVVERNVYMVGRRSGQRRQIDVRVNGAIFGSGSATMIVDCKRYNKPLDVNHVGAFISLLDDVGADIGLLVSTQGASPAARQLAESARGVRLDIVPVEHLDAWSPHGTATWEYAVPEDRYPEAARVLRRAGFRVRPEPVDEWRGNVGVGLRAFRHLGTPNPSGEMQAEARERLMAELAKIGVNDPVALSSGIVSNGGTPAHRWLEVTAGGHRTGLKVLVSSEDEIAKKLDWTWEFITERFGHIDRAEMDVLRPEVWPIPVMFPRW